MRRGVILMIAVALVLTQCKKYKSAVKSVHSNNVHITLDAGGGAKTNVDPATGDVAFVYGDEIIVANNGTYVGRLTYDGTVFRGTIIESCADDYLHFYHLGNKNVGDLVPGESTGCSVSIADQATYLPVISYAHSTVRYSPEVTNYSARLQNKCALVKFDVTNSSPYAGACITDMNNKVTVSFSDASFVYDMENDGKITLASGNGEKLTILLPQEEVAAGGMGSAFSGVYTGTRGRVSKVIENKYITDGVPVVIATPTNPTGALSGLFTVNSDGKQVRFSQANLSYVKKTGIWEFYKYQYTVYMTDNYLIGVNYSKTSIKKVAHFGFGTSGFKHGAVFYQPWMTEGGAVNYYAYGDVSKNLDDDTQMADWGYNAINNGGNAYKQWRTLTQSEFDYLINGRNDAAKKLSYGKVHNVYDYTGLIILPDDWTPPYEVCFNEGIFDRFDGNTYTSAQWKQMEDNGAVFLVAGGNHDYNMVAGPNLFGMYGTVTLKNANESCCFYFDTSNGVQTGESRQRHRGYTVRLVIE